MEKIRPILYGVADYAQIRKKNAWFVDRTAKIRDLESIAYAVFLRPRRFGKSLLLSILEAYYDVAYADRFEQLFAGTAIGADPTEERNRYLVLYFNFSAVSKDVRQVGRSFEKYSADRFDAFAEKYAKRLPAGLSEKILASSSAADKMSALFAGMKGVEPGIYCLIDEYDNFTNTILAESGEAAYNALCHGDGFFKQFFTELKALTTSLDAPLKRLFITGVSPVTMDDVTSGFNIGTNISLRPQFADFTGFRHEDIRAMADYYAPRCGFDADKAYDAALTWYDNYRFASADAPPLANTTLVLYFFEQLVNAKVWPDDMVDENLRTDYAKIHGLREDLPPRDDGPSAQRQLPRAREPAGRRHAGGADHQVVPGERAFEEGELHLAPLLARNHDDHGREVREDGFRRAERDAEGTRREDDPGGVLRHPQEFDINHGLCDFAEKGEWHGFIGILSGIVKENFAVRDGVEGEKVVQSTLVALLTAAKGPYLVSHEREAGGGFYDLALAPRLDRWPDIAHAALISTSTLPIPPSSPSGTLLGQRTSRPLETTPLGQRTSRPLPSTGSCSCSTAATAC